MELIYCAMLLHKAKKEINEENVTKVLEATGIKPEQAKVKALVAALDGVDIEKAIKESSVPVATVAPTEAAPKKEEKSKEEEKKSEETAAAGLGALFG